MQDRSLKIYKPQDIEGLKNIDNLKLKTHEDCERLIEETKNKCASLEQDAYDAAMSKFREEQLHLFEQTHKKVSDFFASTQTEINSILKVLVDKLKIEKNATKILSNLLFAEVEKLKIKSNKFTVYANNQVLTGLQANIQKEYEDNDNVHFDYDLKADLSSEECLIESDYVMARLNVKDFQEKVLSILAENNKVI